MGVKPLNYPSGQDRLSTGDCDACSFRSLCAFSDACARAGYSEADLKELHCLVEHVGPFQMGEHIFRTGDRFRALFAVRRGSVKTSVVNREGQEQILGFYLPGEVIGLNAIYPEQYPCNAVALEEAEFCRFSFPDISELAAHVPTVQQHLFRLLSKELGAASRLAGNHTSDERVAAFLIDLGDRYRARGFRFTSLTLSMSRGDIANYLRLVPETVSRVLGRLRDQELIRIEGRQVTLLDIEGLRQISCQVFNS